jgi:glutaredoxin
MIREEVVENVTVYSTTTCSSCRVLMKWLDSEDISYSKVSTDESDEAMAKFIEINDGILSVPFTVIRLSSGSEIKIHGFQKPKLKESLGL